MKFSKILERSSFSGNKVFITSDWHLGEEKAENNHSFLSDIGVEDKKILCRSLIDNLPSNSKIIFLGDAAISEESLNEFITYFDIPKVIDKTFILGDKETEFLPNKKDLPLDKIKNILEDNGWKVFDKLISNVGGKVTLIIHRPTDAIKELTDDIEMVLCGHVHGIWRTQKILKDNKEIPIINVGIDAWANQLVNQVYIEHQYNAVKKGYYDKNCFINI